MWMNTPVPGIMDEVGPVGGQEGFDHQKDLEGSPRTILYYFNPILNKKLCTNSYRTLL